jgi:hypothetical protein
MKSSISVASVDDTIAGGVQLPPRSPHGYMHLTALLHTGVSPSER